MEYKVEDILREILESKQITIDKSVWLSKKILRGCIKFYEDVSNDQVSEDISKANISRIYNAIDRLSRLEGLDGG